MCEKMEAPAPLSGSLQPVAEDVDEEIGGARTAGNDSDLPSIVEGETHAVRLGLIARSPVDDRRTYRRDASGIDGEISRVDGVHNGNIGKDRSCIRGNEVGVGDCSGSDAALCSNRKHRNPTRGEGPGEGCAHRLS
jgi:hypothetical protein